MAEFVTVAKVDEIPEGSGKAFELNGRRVGVYYEKGQYWAIDDACPHMGASLCAGHFEEGVVVCPLHAWRFQVCDGTWCDSPNLKVDRFEVRVEGDEIQILIPEQE